MSKLNVLVVEDETIVAMGLVNNVERIGYSVVGHASNVAMAQKMFKDLEVDIILMDIDLKDRLNGIELYKSFQTNIPIIYLTGYKSDDIMMHAISTNPIGYLLKPIRLFELKAMLKLVCFHLHNIVIQKERLQDIGDGYSFDKKKEELYYHDLQVKLNQKELKLLELLLSTHGVYVSYKTIEDEIYQNQVIHHATIRTFLYRFKKKLEFKEIHSEYGYGIKLL